LFRFGISSPRRVCADYFFLVLGSVVSCEMLFVLDCFLVRSIVFSCSDASKGMMMPWVGGLPCSTSLVQGFGDIVFCCFVG
jgi:hypothetical protein